MCYLDVRRTLSPVARAGAAVHGAGACCGTKQSNRDGNPRGTSRFKFPGRGKDGLDLGQPPRARRDERLGRHTAADSGRQRRAFTGSRAAKPRKVSRTEAALRRRCGTAVGDNGRALQDLLTQAAPRYFKALKCERASAVKRRIRQGVATSWPWERLRADDGGELAPLGALCGARTDARSSKPSHKRPSAGWSAAVATNLPGRQRFTSSSFRH